MVAIELGHGGEASRFAGELRVDQPGAHEVVVHAHDPSNGNTGVDRTTFVVGP